MQQLLCGNNSHVGTTCLLDVQLFVVQAIGCNQMVANYVLLTFHINSTPIWRLGKHLLIIRPYEYNNYLPAVMSFHLVHDLPRLVAMVANYSMCERKVNNLIFIFIRILYEKKIIRSQIMNNYVFLKRVCVFVLV